MRENPSISFAAEVGEAANHFRKIIEAIEASIRARGGHISSTHLEYYSGLSPHVFHMAVQVLVDCGRVERDGIFLRAV